MAPVQCFHDADPGKHRWPIVFRYQQQRLHRGLPFFFIVLCVRQLGNVFCRVAQCDQWLPARHYDWIEKPLIP
ncbi:hypothetical protein GWE18_06575 [Bradyrhizobium sp. CSA112]|uniref:hypothetical protein n=1 Tax=Bradyrhizobium sp. CSA112 TaxID=2699170 RepID=UPI0023AF407D|nr:hypothetical protein [Bradyrhizobium sp. CSA112]MDE5452540.1 hypothetical protein [Bradyrhizobium sp. CSA112]